MIGEYPKEIILHLYGEILIEGFRTGTWLM